jgi:hypothetical protein
MSIARLPEEQALSFSDETFFLGEWHLNKTGSFFYTW